MSQDFLSISCIQNYLKYALRSYLNVEMRNSRGVVRNEANRLNYAIYYYISYLEDLILNNVDPDVIKTEECQLLTEAKEYFKYQPMQSSRRRNFQREQRGSINLNENKKRNDGCKRRSPESDDDDESIKEAKHQRKQYNLRSSLTNKCTSDDDDDDDNVIIIENDENEIEVTIEREEIISGDTYTMNNLNENNDKIPLNQQQSEPISPIRRHHDDTSVIELDCTPLKINSPVVNNIELNTSSINEMLDLVNEVLLDQQLKQQTRTTPKMPILTPTSLSFTSSSPALPCKVKPLNTNEYDEDLENLSLSLRPTSTFELARKKEYDRIYQELYSVCNRN